MLPRRWVNGAQVTKGESLPPWKQLPWKKYKQVDVTGQLRNGNNLLAVQITHYVVNPNGMASEDTPPMSATLVAQLADGSTVHFATGAEAAHWKASIHLRRMAGLPVRHARTASVEASDCLCSDCRKSGIRAAWQPVAYTDSEGAARGLRDS